MTSHATNGIQHTTGSWITSVVFHDDAPATYAVHKTETAPDLIADCIQDEKTAILIAAAPKLLEQLEVAESYLRRIVADGVLNSAGWAWSLPKSMRLIRATITTAKGE
jgi:hypothetical protein